MSFWLAMRGARPYQLEPGVDVTIGRGRHCDLSLYSSLLSREHARIRWEGEQPVLFDLESLNGIHIGPDRIHRRVLQDGDVIRLGDHMIQFRSSEAEPLVPGEEDLPPPLDVDPTPVGYEPGTETRLYSRTARLHQRVFEYDELYWILERVESHVDWIKDPQIAEPNLGAWFARLDDEAVFWHLLRSGVLAPRSHEAALRDLSAERFAGQCSLTKRGERLRALIFERKVHWNEMAALRYRVRQGPIFKPLRMVARAYRPGGTVKDLRLADVLYELKNIYAADMEEATISQELARLQCLGFLCPGEGRRAEAWYPNDWTDRTVELAPRGFAMLEGFRLEE